MASIAARSLGFFLFVLSALVVSQAVPASAATATVSGSMSVARTWGTDGRVDAILAAGDRVYIGGTFNSVTDPAGNNYAAQNLAVYLPATGAFDTSFTPRPDGVVNALAISGARLYLGGDFSTVGGLARQRLASVDATSGAVSSWAPQVNNVVNALAASNGSVYVGGLFDHLTDSGGSHGVVSLARVNATSGVLDTSWNVAVNDQVRALAFSDDGSALYVGGDFTSLDGSATAAHLGSVNTSNGQLTTGFKADAYGGGTKPPVNTLNVDGSTLLVGASGSGGACAALNSITGHLNWTIHTNGNVQGIAVLNGTVYCGGHFNGSGAFAGLTRYKLGLITESTGAILDYTPRIDSALGVWSIAAGANLVYLGGDFASISGVPQPHLATLIPPGGTGVPARAMNLNARPGEASARLFWEPPWTDNGSPVKSYSIYRGASGGAMTRVANSTTTSWTDSGLTDGTQYTYAVVAVSAIGSSALSATTSVVPTPGMVLAPTAPRALRVTGSAGRADLTWSPPADDGQSPVTSYLVLRSTVPGAEQQVGSVSGSTTSYADTAVAANTTYYYTVVAVNSVGRSPASTESAATITSVRPGAPTLSATVSSGVVNLSWTLPSSGSAPIKQYVVLRNAIQYAHITAPTRTYSDTAVRSGTTYVYQVRAVSDAGNGKLSNKVTVNLP